jgi:ABC-type methionine transport system ATPase subunit
MARKRVRLTFPEDLIREPMVYRLGHQFAVVTNIRMADIDEYTGWVILEIDGEADEIDRALTWAEASGLRVDPVEGDVVEGN